jgi:hypothetical protein
LDPLLVTHDQPILDRLVRGRDAKGIAEILEEAFLRSAPPEAILGLFLEEVK